MGNLKKLYCHYAEIRCITENIFLNEVGEEGIISLSDLSENKHLELMIFMQKEKSNGKYEVRVYKARKTDRYMSHSEDMLQSFEENNEYTSFIFEEFEKGIEFIAMIPYRHHEYCVRPVRKIVC